MRELERYWVVVDVIFLEEETCFQGGLEVEMMKQFVDSESLMC